jgi:hypothetical protein
MNGASKTREKTRDSHLFHFPLTAELHPATEPAHIAQEGNEEEQGRS